VLLDHYLEQGAGKMKLGLSRRAVYRGAQTVQLDRDGAQSLPHIGRSLRLTFYRLFIAAAGGKSQESPLRLDGHAGAEEISDFRQRFDITASGRRHSRPFIARCRDGAESVREPLPAPTCNQRYPQHRRTQGRTDAAPSEHAVG
jgi:hypothetical protein